MRKEIWTLRKLNLSDEETEQLSNTSTVIYHSRTWNIIGVSLFPILTAVFFISITEIQLNIGTIGFIVLLAILGVMFVISLKQIITNKPAIELTSQSLGIRGIKVSWNEVSELKFVSGIEGSNPTMKLKQLSGNELEIGLGYLSKQPKEIHTLICKYYSLANSDI